MNFAKIKREHDLLRNEYQICKRKLDSKCEALLILSQDLDQCRQERDQFKLMAEQVQERYQAIKRQLAGVGPRPHALESLDYAEMKQQSLAHLLCEMREVNKALQFEVDDLKQKLSDAQGDIKLLREQIARQRVGTTDEGMTTRHFPAHEREDLVKQLEASREQFEQLERDLQQVLDEKEELVTERDVYKNKHERLNQELNYILKGDENRIVDIDALSMENKYLLDRLKQMEEEKTLAMATASKYKSLLERKKNKGIIKLGQNRQGGVVVSQKQVQQLLETKSCLMPTPQMMADLQSVASALLETVNDKNLALSHQRKTNKILGNRVSELEKKLKTLEVSGLWNVPGRTPSDSLEKLKQECEEIKTLVPTRTSQSSDHDLEINDKDFIEDVDSSEVTPAESPIDSPIKKPKTGSGHGLTQNAGLSLEDLDFLPTKEEPGLFSEEDFTQLEHREESSPVNSPLLDSLDPLFTKTSNAEVTVGILPTEDEDPFTIPDEDVDENNEAFLPVSLDDTTTAQLHDLLEGATKWVTRHDEEWGTDSLDTKPRSKSYPEISIPEIDSKESSTSLPHSPKCTSPLLDK